MRTKQNPADTGACYFLMSKMPVVLLKRSTVVAKHWSKQPVIEPLLDSWKKSLLDKLSEVLLI